MKMYNRNFNVRTRNGFTLASLFTILWVFFCLFWLAVIIYAGVHFACKFW